mmetsp:Transcript_147170/g.472731  ORF Transcript_147170/g.472731 Transcript_147170/m.472731 type:complete len:217 (+) Transcript_147170:666-1316(+)
MWWKDVDGAVGRKGGFLGPSGALGGGSNALRRVLGGALIDAEAEAVAHELARDLAGAEGHCKLVAGRPRLHLRAIRVDVPRARGGQAIVAVVDLARLTPANLRGDDHVTGAGVEDDGKLLGLGDANGDRTEVDALVGNHPVVRLHGHPLPVQRHREASRRGCRWGPPLPEEGDAAEAQGPQELHEHEASEDLCGGRRHARIDGCHGCCNCTCVVIR